MLSPRKQFNRGTESPQSWPQVGMLNGTLQVAFAGPVLVNSGYCSTVWTVTLSEPAVNGSELWGGRYICLNCLWHRAPSHGVGFIPGTS